MALKELATPMFVVVPLNENHPLTAGTVATTTFPTWLLKAATVTVLPAGGLTR